MRRWGVAQGKSTYALIERSDLPHVVLSFGRFAGRRGDLTDSVKQELLGKPRCKGKPEIREVAVTAFIRKVPSRSRQAAGKNRRSS